MPRGRPPNSKTLVDRQLGRGVPNPTLPAGDTYIIPNHSGISTHPEFIAEVEKFVKKIGDTMTGDIDFTSNSGVTFRSTNNSIRSLDTGNLDVTANALLTLKGGDNEIRINSTEIDLDAQTNLNSNKIINVTDPSNPQDALTLNYFDNNKPTVKHTKTLYIQNPLATDCFPIGFTEEAVTITNIKGETDTGTVDFNIEERAHGSAEDAGTNIMSTELVADDNGVATTTFSNSGIAASSWMTYDASAVANSPAQLWISITYTVD